MQSSEIKIAIIGAGQASAACITELRRKGFTGIITVISNERHLFYERPPLSKGALFQVGDEISAFSIYTPEKLASLALNIIMGTAIKIDREAQLVHVQNQESIAYDYLVIATGSTPIFPDPNWGSMAQVHTLRDYGNTLALKAKLECAKNVALIGGGWISLELAASARKKGIAVTVFERAPRLCIRNLQAEVSNHLADIHFKNGTEIHFNVTDLTISEQSAATKGLTVTSTIATTEKTSTEKTNTYDLIVVGAGVKLNQGLAFDAGLVCQNGIVVNENGQTNDPIIFAIGDVAQNAQLGTSLQTWANANETGVIAARGILKLAQDAPEIPWFWSDQYDANIQILGLHSVSDRLLTRHISEKESVFLYINAAHQITQVIAFNQSRFLKQAKRWMRANKQIDPIKFEDQSIDLMGI